jgi:nucleoid-associated protein YgaU
MNKNVIAAVVVMALSVLLLVVSLGRPNREVPPELNVTETLPDSYYSSNGPQAGTSVAPSRPPVTASQPGDPGAAADPILITPTPPEPTPVTTAEATPSTMRELMGHLNNQHGQSSIDPNGDLNALPGPGALPPPPAVGVESPGVTPPPAGTGEPVAAAEGAGAGAAADQWYEVQTGDTLTAIAQRFYGTGSKYRLILAGNPGLDEYSLRVGDKIRIPAAPQEVAATSGGGTAAGAGQMYVVQSGDSYYTIARDQLGAAGRYKEIQALNGIPPERLKVGDKLKLPAAGPAPLATPPATAGATPSAGEQTHVVETGDTLTRIASQYYGSGDHWRLIADANGITDPSLVRVGQRLRIPARSGNQTATPTVAPPTAGGAGSRTHTVQPNESMWRIADQYYGRGDQWKVIAAANPHIDPDNLLAGQKITIPPAP